MRTDDRFQPWRQKLADGEAKKRLRADGNYPTDGDIHPMRLCKEIKNFMLMRPIAGSSTGLQSAFGRPFRFCDLSAGAADLAVIPEKYSGDFPLSRRFPRFL